jgi:hypothetical protein
MLALLLMWSRLPTLAVRCSVGWLVGSDDLNLWLGNINSRITYYLCVSLCIVLASDYQLLLASY